MWFIISIIMLLNMSRYIGVVPVDQSVRDAQSLFLMWTKRFLYMEAERFVHILDV